MDKDANRPDPLPGEGTWTLSPTTGSGRCTSTSTPTQSINVILDEIGKDPTCVFWG